MLLVGAPGRDVGSQADQGVAYSFHLKNGNWVNDTLVDPITETGGAAGDNAGYAVALGGGRAIVGAPQLLGRSAYTANAIDTNGNGHVFVREVSAPTTVTVADSQTTLIEGAKANVVTGTIGGVATADLKFFDIGRVELDTGAAADVVTINRGGLNAFGLGEFKLKTGGGDDTVNLRTDKLKPPALGTYALTGVVNGVPQYTLVGGGFSIDGGSGDNLLAATANTDWTLSAAALISGNGSQVALGNFRNTNITGGAGSNRIRVTGWVAGGVATLDGGLGSDEFIVEPAAFDAVVLNDAGGMLDQLTLVGTAGVDEFTVNAHQVNLVEQGPHLHRHGGAAPVGRRRRRQVHRQREQRAEDPARRRSRLRHLPRVRHRLHRSAGLRARQRPGGLGDAEHRPAGSSVGQRAERHDLHRRPEVGGLRRDDRDLRHLDLQSGPGAHRQQRRRRLHHQRHHADLQRHVLRPDATSPT